MHGGNGKNIQNVGRKPEEKTCEDLGINGLN